MKYVIFFVVIMGKKAYFDEKQDNCPIFSQHKKYKMYIIPFLSNVIAQFSLGKNFDAMAKELQGHSREMIF